MVIGSHSVIVPRSNLVYRFQSGSVLGVTYMTESCRMYLSLLVKVFV